MESEERPAKRWELTNAESRITRLEKQQDREDHARTWMYRSITVGFITLVANILVGIIIYYVFRIHK